MSGRGPLRVFGEGLRVLGGELGFALGNAARRLEIRHLEKRLAEEYARLGSPGGGDGLARVEADFLAEEASRVRREIEERGALRAACKAAAHDEPEERP